METAYQSLSFKKRIKLTPILLIAAAMLVAFVLLAGYLLVAAYAELDLPSDPPPIIIKSGSFIMESEKVFQPDLADQRNYKNLLFNTIKGIRIISYTENGQAQAQDRKYFEGKDDNLWAKDDDVQVNIYIQTCQPDAAGTCTNWSALKRVVVNSVNNNLEVNVPSELHLSKGKKNKKNKRQYKNEDENNEYIRFKIVEIYNNTKHAPIDSFSAVEGQEYYIGFYNTLVNKSGGTTAQ